ncbi:MAG: hypothetical protein EAZ97_06365 [Bacteroidetes bacterium]|nr:MAG: hypothetical protein EAZ97_06365 [Bacteroidota bacterium]
MKKNILILICLPFFLCSCAALPQFSMTGMALNPKAKKIAIQNFYSDVASGPANLAIDFSEKLRDYYQRNTPLAVTKEGGELALAGTIVGYEVTPIAPQANASSDPNQPQQIAGQQRLTITIKVQYSNTLEEDQDFDQNFSFFADFGSGVNLSSVEKDLIDKIFTQITLDIFNKTLANW